MVAVAQYHLDVPRSRDENLTYRQSLIEQASECTLRQTALLKMCADDVLFWINSFIWQFNPNPIGDQLEVGPFITWDFQEEGVRQIEASIDERFNLRFEK